MQEERILELERKVNALHQWLSLPAVQERLAALEKAVAELTAALRGENVALSGGDFNPNPPPQPYGNIQAPRDPRIYRAAPTDIDTAEGGVPGSGNAHVDERENPA